MDSFRVAIFLLTHSLQSISMAAGWNLHGIRACMEEQAEWYRWRSLFGVLTLLSAAGGNWTGK
jgi:hypothetical protein